MAENTHISGYSKYNIEAKKKTKFVRTTVEQSKQK